MFVFRLENTHSVQDTIVVVPPYPYNIEDDPADVPFEDCWYARPQLFFTCHLRPAGARPPKNPSYKIGPDDLLFQLVFFSTFEELHLPIHGPMEDADVIKLCDISELGGCTAVHYVHCVHCCALFSGHPCTVSGTSFQ